MAATERSFRPDTLRTDAAFSPYCVDGLPAHEDDVTADPASVTITCRFCVTKNRIPIERAHADMTKVKCGSCGAMLLRVNGEPLPDIPDDELAHPWDREALAKLRAVPLADMVIQRFMGGTVDKLRHFQMMSGAVRVGPRQAPRLWRLYLEAAGRLDIDPPPLFITQHPLPNAFTGGAGKPIVAVTTGLLETFDDRCILGVLGHELTHVRLGHVTYRTLATLLASGALRVLNIFGLAGMALTPIRMALFRWYQMSELSADRGELLATGSLETFVRSHMILAGGSRSWADELDVGAFIEQAHEAEALRDNDLLISLMEMVDSTSRSHPLVVWRVHHGLRWAESGALLRLLAGRSRLMLEG